MGQQTALAGLAGGLVWALLGCDAPPPKSATAPIATVAQPANTNTASAAPEAPTATQSANTVRLSALPPLGQQIYQQILQGGPFAYDKDGAVFANRERILPAQKRGYYREYTVAHAHARNRGPRRIGVRRAAPMRATTAPTITPVSRRLFPLNPFFATPEAAHATAA